MGLFYEYFVSGIADSGISHFGGDVCYNEIPADYHWTVSLIFGLISIFVIWYWRHTLGSDQPKIKKLEINLLEKVCIVIGLVSLLWTFYFKLQTKCGFFMLNPCHVTLLLELILLTAKDNTNVYMRRLHLAWTAWLLGPFGAFTWPHTQNMGMVQFVLYYAEHLIILPIGPLILNRRYGNTFPSHKNHFPAYATLLAYQLLFLVPVSRLFKVNLNFSLCHSPSEPYADYGHHYFLIEIFNVCLVAYAVRLTTFLYVSCFSWVGSKLGLKEKEE